MSVTREDEAADLLFKALADPTRRALLDALHHQDGQSLQELSTRHPEMTRFGVKKHLNLLVAAGLVITQKNGRQLLHYLNPIPIEQIANRWISKYSARFTAALNTLKTDLEAPEG